jgi:uncharacterized protein
MLLKNINLTLAITLSTENLIMKNKIFKYTSLLLSLTSFLSCESKGQFSSAKDNKTLLWEITGNDLQKPVYIYGTMHLLCAKDALLSNNLKQIVQNVDEIYFEIDMDDISELLTGFKEGKMKHDTTLADLYSSGEYQRIKDFFDHHGMGMELQMLNRMQPMLISALVYQAILPCEQADGIELSIMQFAHQYKKEIKGLETAAFQASVLDNIPYAAQAKELLYSIDSAQSTKSETEEMIKLYKEQDLDKLLDYSLKTEAGTTTEIQDIMINKRNKNWVKQLPGITKNKSILIAVGAGHLGGESGLLNLLKEKGYKLRPLENSINTNEEENNQAHSKGNSAHK